MNTSMGTGTPGGATRMGNLRVGTSIGTVAGISGGGTQNNLRTLVRMLEQQVADLRAQNQLLQSLLDRQSILDRQTVACVPDVCRWDSVRPHMRSVPEQLMLGLDPQKSRIHPQQEHIKEAILEIFTVDVNDICTRKAFDRAWTKELKTHVMLAFSNRRGRFSTNARMELWRLLGIPKPVNASEHEIEQWKRRMRPIYEDFSWRREGDDPFGADAFYGAIGYVKFGRNFTNSMRVKLLPRQLAWFAYLLDLAMQGDLNLKYNGFHNEEVEHYETFIMENRHVISRIELIEGAEAVAEVLGVDEVEDDDM